MTTPRALRAVAVVHVFGFLSCIDLSVPAPPGPPQPGVLLGRVVVAQPGRTERVPVAGAEVFLLGSGLTTTSDSSGSFLLSGISRSAGHVLVRADLDVNGAFERQRLISLEALKAGPGKSITLGDVVLGDNARLEGRVLRADVRSGQTGHAGTLAFVPEGPFSALSADNGSWSLDEMPEGTVSLSFHRAGYRARELADLQLSAGQTVTLREIALTPLDPSEMKAARLSGRLVPVPAAELSRAHVELVSEEMNHMSSVTAAGEFAFTLEPGLYSLRVSLPGYRTAVISNIIMQGADRDLGSIVLTTGSGSVGGTGGGVAGGTSGGAAGGTSGGAAGGTGGGTGGAGGGTADGTAGGGSAGGASGGQVVPVAVVDARSFATRSSQVRLDALRSFDPLDAGPLSFRWRETSDAGVLLGSNDSVNAGAPLFTAPGAPAVVRFELVVTSFDGRSSAPAHTTVEVLEPPNARVSPQSLVMRTGSTALLSASSSSDPAGAPLTFTWSVSAGAVTLSAMSGTSVVVTAPSLPGAAELRLVVANPGVSAEPVMIPVVVSASATPIATVTVSPPQVVGRGTAVMLSATATSTDAREGFSFFWRQASGPSPLALISVDTAATGFAAPAQLGRYSFTVTATGDAGAVGSATATVDVEDLLPPILVSSDPPDAPGAAGGWYSLTALFDEALDPASVSGGNVTLSAGTQPVPVDLQLELGARRIRVTPRLPLVPGNAYTLTLSGVTDATPRRNPFPGRTLAFNARPPRFTPWSRAMGHTNLSIPAMPGLAVSSSKVWLFSRDSNGVQAAPTVFEPNWEDGGVVTRFQFPTATNTVPVRRGHLVNDVPHFFTNANGGAQVFLASGAASWQSYAPSGEIGIASDGTRLVGLRENYGAHWLSFSSPSVVALDTHIESFVGSMPAWSSINSGSGPQLFTLAISGTAQFVAIPITFAGSTTRYARSYLRTGNGPWQNLTSLGALPPEPREMRATFMGTTPVLCYVHVPTSGAQLSCSAWNGSTWAQLVDVAPGIVESLDLFTRQDLTWLTFASGGRIQVRMLRLTSASTLTAQPLLGPAGTAAWNVNGSCTGAHPETFATAEALYITWEEGCGGNAVVWLHRVE